MISHEEALQLIREHVGSLGTEEMETAQCASRVLATDLVAQVSSPPFHKAAMDGFAVRADDVGKLPVELEIVGESFAGQWPDFKIGPGRCAAIATGAPVPQGADTVVMVEHTSRPSESEVRIEKLSGKNICMQGEDIAEGQVVLRKGQALTPLRVGVAASVGYDRLTVYRRPSIALLCTGTEVVEPPAPVREGQIYNSNASLLTALLAPVGSRFDYLGIVKDRPEELDAALEAGLERDVLVIAGGVSVGPYDLVPDALKRLDVETVFYKCAIKPGKPVLFGKRDRTYVFGLPGNPHSCFVVFHVLMRAAIALMSGADELPPHCRTGLMRHGFDNKPERKNFRPCRVETEDGVNRIELVPSQGAADIMGAAAGNAVLAIPQGMERVEADQTMEFFEV